MARKPQTSSKPQTVTSNPTSIYISIVAESHDEMLEKVAAMYHGLCSKPVVTPAAT